MKKVVAEKFGGNVLDNMLFFGGHGYISESMVARMDEKEGLYEHFPWLRRQKNGIGFIDHTQEDVIKFRLMNELMRPELDYAVLHHHGYWDTQYLNNIPRPKNPLQAKEMIQSYGRAHIRAAREKGKSVDSMMVKMERRFDIPHTWLGNTFEPEICRKDSVEDADLDLHLADFATYDFKPNCRVVMIDACFCGSFHQDDCIANEYIFQPGSTVAVIANTVNALQDKWYDRFIGLTAQGGCVGDVVRFSNLLESHVIGDPTFRFAPVPGSVDVDGLLLQNKASSWKRLLKSPLPDVQSLAIEQLRKAGALSSADLLRIYRESPYGVVRLEALMALSATPDDHFITAVTEASQDAYELVQRQAIRFIAKNGDRRLIPALIRLSIANNTSDRCNFNVMTALACFPKEDLLAEFDRQFDAPSVQYLDKQNLRGKIRNTIAHSADRLTTDIDKAVKGEASKKERTFTIRALRNTLPHHKVPELLAYLQACGDGDTQILLLEALGWHTVSYHATDIAATALKMSEDASLPDAVRQEALKTYRRIHEK